jgi:hypothetical protein
MSLAGRGNCNRPYGSRDAQGKNVFWNTPVEVVPEWALWDEERLAMRGGLFVKSIPQGLKPTLILLSLRHD